MKLSGGLYHAIQPATVMASSKFVMLGLMAKA
jgi:hypothetical protein